MRKKRVYINARFLTQSVTGVQRYAMELVKAFDRMIESGSLQTIDLEFIMLAPSGCLPPTNLKCISFRTVGLLSGHLWEQLELPFYARNGLLINPCNAAPMVKRHQVVTMHDASVFAIPDTYLFAFRVWYRLLFRITGFMSRLVVTDSHFSKQELHRYCKIGLSKIEVIYLGKEHIHDYDAEPDFGSKLSDKNRYVLAVSSMSPNKNFRSIVQAVQSLGDRDFDVVIAGGTHPKVFGASHTEKLNGLIYLGYVTDSQLRSLYENADCFVYPSFYEGFGLPPLEAMASGCPVIVSDAASLPEVCGEAALYCDPSDPGNIAEKIRQLMSDPHMVEELRVKGLKQASRFTWDSSANEMIKVIRGVMKCELPLSMTG